MKQFFANLKRLFEPRTPPPAQTNAQPSADRPPPAEGVEPESPPATASLDAIPAVDDASDISEVRALLEAVAEVPVAAVEPEPEAPATAPEPEQLFPEASTEEIVDAPSELVDSPRAVVDSPSEVVAVPSAAPVGDALVLALATPAATFTVAKAAATIGRGQENTIRLDDLSVSRRHARIAYKQGGYWLSDLGSMGGTWVDGTRLNAPQRIDAGQIIDIGLCRLTVSSVGRATKSETKKSARPRSEMAEQGRRRR